MVATPAPSAVFDFENILPQLDFLPIAARRALDHAGLRLSLEAWRSLGLDDRCQLVAAGADDLVDAAAVAQIVRRAAPQAQRIEVVGDPDPLAPPDGLTRLLEPVPLDARQWARLRALDRYALAHVHRRSIARNDPSLIQAAYEDIVTGHLRSLRPPPGEAGGRGTGSTTPPPPAVPPPPLLPRNDGRLGRSYDTSPAPGRAQQEAHLRSYEATPAPGRVNEPASSSRSRDLARGYETSSGRGYDASISGRGYETPSPGRGYDALGRGHDAASARAFDAALPHGHDATPAPPRAFDTPPSGHVYPGLSRRNQDVTGRVHEAPPPARSYVPRGSQRISSVPPPSDPPGEIHPEIPELTPLAPDVLSTHLTEDGAAHMIDVGQKPVTERRAVASAIVQMRRDTFRRLAQHDTPKGDVLAAARIAGIQAAKRTSELIPLCHAIALTSVDVDLELDDSAVCVLVTATARAFDRTGVEMEALVAASVASLTIYDMLKGIDREMIISDVKLLEKSGGRTGHYHRSDA